MVSAQALKFPPSQKSVYLEISVLFKTIEGKAKPICIIQVKVLPVYVLIVPLFWFNLFVKIQIKFIVISLMLISFKDYPHVDVIRGHAVNNRKYCFYLDRFVLSSGVSLFLS